jgi:hypothetical protein
MRDQTAALKYLAEKQFERVEREHRRDLILAALLAPVMVTVTALFTIVRLTQPRFGGVFFRLNFLIPVVCSAERLSSPALDTSSMFCGAPLTRLGIARYQ